MNLFKKIMIVGLLVLFGTFCIAQSLEFNSTIKRFNKNPGGECIIKDAQLSVDNQIVSKTFTIEVPARGEYYLNAWLMGTSGKDGFNEISVHLNGDKKAISKIKPTKTGWQVVKLLVNEGEKVKKTVSLPAGTYSISFKTKAPEVPEIEFIKLSTNEQDIELSTSAYNNYVDYLSSLSLPPNYDQIKADYIRQEFSLKKVLPNPEGNYKHSIGQKFGYCYYKQFYFYAGAPVTFETKNSNADPVMRLFNSSDPINKGSWVDDDGGSGYNSKISVTVQHTGYYYLILTAYWCGTDGTCDLYLYDNLHASNCPMNNWGGIRCDHSKTIELNYFTSHVSESDTRLWIEDQNGFPGRFIAYNDDYYGNGDFEWWLDSRVKKAFSTSIRSTHVTAYGSYNPTDYADVYMNCENSTVNQNNYPYSFPNLKADDAIQSAPESVVYNCISWSGGIYSDWVWPPDDWPWSDYYTTPPLTAFDNYYGNKAYWGETYARYNDAWNYTRSGATSSNNQVDLWSLNGSYKHGSVNSRYDNIPCDTPANGHPHGYDWESKPGGLMRTFHPRNALSGNAYGSVDKYYRYDGTRAHMGLLLAKNVDKGMTLEESVAAGLSAIEEVEFSESENAKLASFIEKLPEEVKQEFNTKYIAWKETWKDPKIAIHSNPRKYAESKQYEEFLDFCQKHGKAVWPLLFSNFQKGTYFDFIPIRDLSYSEYRPMLDELSKQYRKPRYTDKVVYIVPLPRPFKMRYIQKLLALPDDTWGENSEPFDEKLGKSSLSMPEKFTIDQNYPNPFNPVTQIRYGLPSESRVSIRIYDIVGREIATLVNDEVRTAGWHTITWDSRDHLGNMMASGIYFCRLIVGTQVQIIKLILMR